MKLYAEIELISACMRVHIDLGMGKDRKVYIQIILKFEIIFQIFKLFKATPFGVWGGPEKDRRLASLLQGMLSRIWTALHGLGT